MKKLIWIVTAFLVAALGWLYLAVPNLLRISNSVTVEVPEAAVTRLLLFNGGWKSWWPSEPAGNDVFSYGDVGFRVEKFTNSYVATAIKQGDLTVNGLLNFSAIDKNITVVRWQFDHALSLNPVWRIREYQKARNIERAMKAVLQHFQKFTGNKENIYGIGIEYSKVKDTVVAVISSTSREYPSTNAIYDLINSLLKHTQKMGIDKNGYPMVNVTRLENRQYSIMVAIPVKRKAQNFGNIRFKSLVPGNILIATVNGGKATVDHAMLEMSNYVRDMRHISPAIPFQKFISNRMTEPDTSKWITELYYPIF
ncbi:MAG TPA: hypothetical protein VGE26_01695 [Sphingobacteriaceae bacterium]